MEGRRCGPLEEFIRDRQSRLIADLKSERNIPYQLTLVGNVDGTSLEVAARTRSGAAAFDEPEPLGLFWPSTDLHGLLPTSVRDRRLV